MCNQTSPMEHLAAFAICWAFGMVSFVIGHAAARHWKERWRTPCHPA